MSTVDIAALVQADPRSLALFERLTSPRSIAQADGLWGSSAAIVAAVAARALERPLLYVAAHGEDADDARDDIELAIGRAASLLPALETLPDETDADDESATQRLRLCIELSRTRGVTDEPPLIVTSVSALLQPTPSREWIEQHSFILTRGQTAALDATTERLVECGFQRCDQVEVPGDFAQRGGILDVFPPSADHPVRAEFVGNEIESLRLFTAGTQRSAQDIDEVRIPSCSAAKTGNERHATTGFVSLIPKNTIIALHEPVDIQELGRTVFQRIGERAGLIPVESLLKRVNDFTQLHLYRFAGGDSDATRFEVASLPPFEPRSSEALESLHELSKECHVHVLCENVAERRRFDEMLRENEEIAGAAIESSVGAIHHGFRWGAFAFVPHHELFGRYRKRRTLRRVQPARPIDSFFDLQKGDLVVHALHGIGRFRGLRTLERDGRSSEYLALEFAAEAVVHVPTSQIHVVQKYIGNFRGRPALSKLGGTAWKKAKQRVEDAVSDLAAELLALQAARDANTGTRYPDDTLWQREFEGSFPYTETEDQLRALAEIKSDMCRPRPMDRLLCGDVGFGKTELALRAAFKTVEYGRQVAVLVPTTVLAEQHFQTFRERLADYPFAVEVLSRFRTKGEQSRIIARTRKGQVDILIGTHRLLSKDVRFADLGLVVIDEEQRFGVEAKEGLKKLRATVDVLTLSATPIPRTLHMSLLGIREISSLATPPIDRRAIVTSVRMWDNRLIREAIVRELNRDGQVYFVHNFVRDIDLIANRLRTIVPEARIAVGHGQMSGRELEAVMLQFMQREADILVSTNIIESGIDIATANTIFVNRAERFGLADLHQLRGRVGRSRHRAYCYALLSPKHPVNDIAARRLKAIEQYSQLGAGFQIAMRDLEIRGAGNLLGAEQSGHIEAVGYEMYCQLLEQAVRTIKDEPADPWRQVNLELGVTASIPRSYIRSERQRMEVYKRLASCRATVDVRSLGDDLRDAFGALPDEVTTLLTLAEIRVASQAWGIRTIVLDPPDVIFSIDEIERVQPLFADGPGSPRIPDGHTVHWRLPKRLLAPASLVKLIRERLQTPAAPEPALQV